MRHVIICIMVNTIRNDSEFANTPIIPINIIKAKTPNVAYALAFISGCRVWYIFKIHIIAITYIKLVSIDKINLY